MDKVKRFLVAWLVGGFVLAGVALWQLPDRHFHIWFLDIGQGDAILIKTPEQHYILVDGGPGNGVMEQLAEVMPFFVKELDFVILTHPHADHMDGLVEVLRRYQVKGVLLSAPNYNSSTYDQFLTEISDQNLPFWISEMNTDFRFGPVDFDVIYPFEQVFGRNFDNVNNASVGMKVTYGRTRILLTGDLEQEAEAELVANPYLDLRADILKAGHHGSRTSSTVDFLNKVKPKIVVIQCGKDNQFGHPHEETLKKFEQMGVELWRNDLDGRVEFVF